MDIQKGTYTYTGSGGQKRHVPIERVYSFSQLRKGDHIAFERLKGTYWHHAIVEDVGTENGIINVIEYSNSAKELLQDNSSHPKNPGKAKLRRHEYSGSKDGLYLIKHDKCLPADDVVKRAQSRLEENEYDLFENNCEHFAMWCKTEISSCEQVKNIGETARKTTKQIVKNALPLVAREATHSASKGGEEIVTMTLREMTKIVTTQTLSYGGQQIVKAGAQMAVKQGPIQNVSNCGQQIVKAGAQMTVKEGFTQTVAHGGQQIVRSGIRQTTKEVFSCTATKAGEQIVTKGTRETTREVITQTLTTTGPLADVSLMGGAAYAIVFEGTLAAYDIYCAKKDLKAGKISAKECNDAIGKRIAGGVGSVAGSTAGEAIGRALIPFPVAGGIVGGVVGGLMGRFSGSTFWNVVM